MSFHNICFPWCNSHRRGRAQSYVCDPDDVLGHAKAEEVEEMLADIRNKCFHPCGMTFTDKENEEDIAEIRMVPCTVVVAITRVIPPGIS